MIQDRAYWERWEEEWVASIPADFKQNLALVEAMYEEARSLGAFPPADPLEGLEVKYRLARVVNVRTATEADGDGA